MKSWTNKAIFLVSILGMALSAYLWWYQVAPGIIPCTTGGCEHVLTSEYSKILGVPMATYGFFYYLAVAFIALQRNFVEHKFINRTLGALVIFGVLFSLYLRYIEFTKIHQICIWCWLSFLFTLILLAVYVFEQKAGKKLKKEG